MTIIQLAKIVGIVVAIWALSLYLSERLYANSPSNHWRSLARAWLVILSVPIGCVVVLVCNYLGWI